MNTALVQRLHCATGYDSLAKQGEVGIPRERGGIFFREKREKKRYFSHMWQKFFLLCKSGKYREIVPSLDPEKGGDTQAKIW